MAVSIEVFFLLNNATHPAFLRFGSLIPKLIPGVVDSLFILGFQPLFEFMSLFRVSGLKVLPKPFAGCPIRIEPYQEMVTGIGFFKQ